MDTPAMRRDGPYSRELARLSPACALRWAQRELIARYPHPFYWSPFALLGRW